MSILPFPSILDDIKEKGFKKAMLEGVDNTVERITAGMNVQDIREALRGEAPSRRPNPRLQPHADAFWMHMRPSFFHRDVTGLYPTFRLGWLSTYFVVFETITGMFLMIWYTPAPEVAYANMLNIMGNVPLGQFTRDLHRLGAEAMVFIVWLHMLRTFMTGSYKKPRQFTWFTGVILLIATMFLSFSGYLLPWDQLALWAVTIGASMIEATPPEIVGQNLNLLLRGGPDIGANGLLRFYLLHVLAVPAVLFIFTGVHYYKVIVHGHSLPPQNENIGEDTAKRVPLDKRVYFIPDVLTSEIMWIAVTSFIMVVLCVWFYHAPLESHADPQITPIGTTAPWYFLWIQGALKLGDKVIWGIVFPTIVIILLIAIPYIDLNPSRRYADRRFMLSFGFAFISVMTILSYMGLPEYGVASTAENHIMHEMTMEPAHNHMGLLLPIPYNQLANGAYVTRQFAADPADASAAVAAFNEELNSVLFSTGGAEPRLITQADMLAQELNVQHLASQFQRPRFSMVPTDSPELARVMDRFYHMLDHDGDELLNNWGAVIITQEQDNMKRLDVVISWDAVELSDTGAVIRDDNGQPIPVLDANGEQVRRWYLYHIFIHQDSAYFD